MSADETTAPAVKSTDEQRLHELGYAQELRRHMSGFTNFAVSFTIISILSGCLTLYGTGLNSGGPLIITWGWPFVGVMTLFVGLAMAEVCSASRLRAGCTTGRRSWRRATRRRGRGSPAGSTSSARSR